MRRSSGSHAPNCKNRSSKQNTWFTKMKPSVRSMSGERLKELANNKCREAEAEITRRSKLKK